MITAGKFEMKRLRHDQESRASGRSVFLRFAVTGPPGVHPVVARVFDFSGNCPKLEHSEWLSLDVGSTGYVNVTLNFDRDPRDSCNLSIALGGAPLGAFLVQPSTRG